MRAEIPDTSPEQMNGASDDELVEYFCSKYRIEPIQVYGDRAEIEHNETKVDVTGDTLRGGFYRGERLLVKGDQITLHIPFSGEPALLKCTPSQHDMNPPRGEVKKNGELGGTVVMEFAMPSDTINEDRVNSWITSSLSSLTKYADWVSAEVERSNRQLEEKAGAAVQARRKQLETQGAPLKKLVVPLRPKKGMPSPNRVPMPRRVVKPLPAARKVEQEYGLRDQDYEYILDIVRHESRSFESTPGTFARFNEEELRDVVLAHLNGHYKGDAAGERFRKKGKTDICIEHDNRAAFVAECKLWKGEKGLHDAIDQLLGYLTWRDTRAALILWNKKNKNFSKLQQELADFLGDHPSFVRRLNSGHAGEWRASFESKTDGGRTIIIHVFLVDLTTEDRRES